MADFIPDPDPAFNTLATAFTTFVNAHGPAVGLTAGEVTAIDDAFTSDWTPKYASHTAAQDATLGARFFFHALESPFPRRQRGLSSKIRTTAVFGEESIV